MNSRDATAAQRQVIPRIEGRENHAIVVHRPGVVEGWFAECRVLTAFDSDNLELLVKVLDATYTVVYASNITDDGSCQPG